ncbi:MAG: DUF1697 domain-containing protein [Gemmatimonadota bacterium]
MTQRAARRWVALLRGINVGGHRVKNDVLAACFVSLGHTDVRPFLASGNVAFSSSEADPGRLTKGIEQGLSSQLDFEVPTVLRTVTELAVAADFEAAAGGMVVESHYVILLDGAAERFAEGLALLESDFDRFVLNGNDVHWLLAGKMSESPLFRRGIDHVFQNGRHTTRNVNTLRRLVARESG